MRALMHVERNAKVERFQAKDVCEKAEIPEAFTRKVFQALVQAGFLEAARGPGGGYVLTQQSDQISLLAVIKAVDGEDSFDNCIMGLPECGGEHLCPLHPVWAETKERLLEQLASKTLRNLIDTAQLQ